MSLATVDFSKAPDKAPVCLECGADAKLATGADAYPAHETHLHDQPMWVCECGAYCRCKPGTIKPLGRPASAKARAAQTAAERAKVEALDVLRAHGASWNNARKRTNRAWVSVLKMGWATKARHPRSLTLKQAEALIDRMHEVAAHAAEDAVAP